MVDNVVNEIKGELKDFAKSMTVFEKSFDGMVDEVDKLDDNLNIVFKEVKDIGDTVDKKFLSAIKKFFNQMVKNVLDPKVFASLMVKFFKIIWAVMKKVFNLLYNKYPEFRYIIFAALIFMSLPLLALVSSQVSIMQLFLPASVILVILITFTVLIYLNIWNIWTFLFNFVIKTLIKIDWEEITKDVIKELGDLIEEVMNKLIKV